MDDKKLDLIVNELGAIKKLLILLLRNQDVTAETIAQVLGVTQERVSQMAPTKRQKRERKVINE
jgi:predicted transcriptional regulator